MLSTVSLASILLLPFLAGIGVPLASGFIIAMVVYIEALMLLGPNAARNEWRSKGLASGLGFVSAVCLYGLLVSEANRLPLANFFEFAMRLAIVLLAYVVGVRWVKQRDPRQLVVAVAICCVVFSGSGIAFRLIGVGVEVGDILRYRGFAATINNLALYSALGLITSLYLFLPNYSHSGERKWWIGCAICGAGLLASGSLGPMLAVATAALVLVHALGRFNLKSAFLGGGAAVLLLLLAYLASDEHLARRFASALESNLSADSIGDPENSVEWRVQHWSLLLERWWDDFLWFGAGLGQQVELSVFRTMSGEGYAAHNDVIGLLVELGFVGLAVLSIGLILVLRRDMFRLPLIRSVTALFVVSGLSAPTIATGAVQYYAPLLFAACVVELRRWGGKKGKAQIAIATNATAPSR